MNNNGKFALILGVFGMIAGIILFFSGNRFIGFFGSVASGLTAFKGCQDYKKSKKKNT